MSTHKPPSIEERLQQIQEALEQKPDGDAIEKWAREVLREVLFKLKEIHEDVRDLQQDLAYVTSQVDDLQS